LLRATCYSYNLSPILVHLFEDLNTSREIPKSVMANQDALVASRPPHDRSIVMDVYVNLWREENIEAYCLKIADKPWIHIRI